ncbi:Flp family type IVb pilin [Pseudomonas sp. HS-18]|uniref:Flp family type IVb pilin n=1 Tax=Pseudomonas sp. HS-18 TaxID=2879114 RepID=UPI00298F269A|nr:Flp family type IVb pilin [Pseudomonas sp. HS-18]
MEIRDFIKELPLNLFCRFKSFLANREGATAIEYAVIAGLISIALLTAATPIGAKVKELMEAVQEALSGASTP